MKIKGFQLVAALFLSVKLASAAPIFTSFASVGPDAFGSPSWATYVINAINSLGQGSGSTGNRFTSPTAYQQDSVIGAHDFEVSSFNSWDGNASPGAGFVGELGNRLHFGLDIKGNGTAFSLSLLTNVNSSSDGAFGNSGNFIGVNYSSTLIGIQYGGNGVRNVTFGAGGVTCTGGCDDTIYKAGEAGTNVIDELIYVGIGNAFFADGASGPTNQNKLDQVAAYVDSQMPYSLSNQYCLTGISCGSTVTVNVVPEPGTLLLFSLGLAGLLAKRVRVSRRRSTLSL